MQNIDLICVGKLNAPYFAAGVAEYQKRLAAFCRFRIIELPEAPLPDKNASPAQIEKALEKEGKAILAAVRKAPALSPCAWRANRSPARSWQRRSSARR